MRCWLCVRKVTCLYVSVEQQRVSLGVDVLHHKLRHTKMKRQTKIATREQRAHNKNRTTEMIAAGEIERASKTHQAIKILSSKNLNSEILELIESIRGTRMDKVGGCEWVNDYVPGNT